MSPTERVQRFRRGNRRLEVQFDLVTADQVARFAERWGCSKQEVLKMAFRACLPAMREAPSPLEVFCRVRDGLEAQGLE
jgi:hypothetical protein